ncbi:hypothetical protein [Myroides sp. TSA_177.3]|uniref:hypothetical protein n=1 Tax=Myroides sp. TSA_177.3 TaxID=3415650 RepID=UPI0040464C32
MKYILLIGSLKKRITIHLDWHIKGPIMFTDPTGMIGEEVIIKVKRSKKLLHDYKHQQS